MLNQEDAIRSSAENVAKAKAFVEAAEYNDAAVEYGKAAKQLESCLLEVLCAQASALSSAQNYTEAKGVASSAIRLASNFAPAWYQKGNALFNLDDFKAAKTAFEKAASLESVQNSKIAYMEWATRCDEKMKAAEDAEIETMDISTASREAVEEVKTDNQNGSAAEAPPPPPKDNTRMEWYQSATHVNVDIYAKNVVKEQSSVKFEPGKLSVRLVRPDRDDYVLEKDLYGEIKVDESTWGASRFKVEIRMRKTGSGEGWKALDKSGEVLSAALAASADATRRKEEQKSRVEGWSSLADQELKDYKEDDSPMALFRMLYKDADEDTQRAMMKSYTESGGKVLSTNWDEVRKKKVTYEERD